MKISMPKMGLKKVVGSLKVSKMNRAGLYVAYGREKPPPALAPPDPVRAEGNADPGGASPQPPAPGEAAPILPGAGALNPEAPVGGGTGDGAAVSGGGLSG